MPAERTTVTIAEFTMDDYPVVHVLWQLGDLWMRPSDGPEATLLKLTRDPGLFLVARDGSGLIVGTVMGGWDGRRAYLYHLSVLPERRRQGIADALMDEIEERFRRLGALKAKTQILMDNDASRAFFRHRGYLREVDCEPWGKELVEGGAPPCR
ncbi:MAG: GNAT family N-acetyltransferase [Actinobacteria bacterium]|nr:GNAT family N-acetyltransferase [Actinomycetota bacterium]